MRTYTEEQMRNAIRDYMSQRRLTPRSFAAEIGLSTQHIYQAIAGKHPPGPRILKAVGLRRMKTVLISYVEEPANGRGKAKR